MSDLTKKHSEEQLQSNTNAEENNTNSKTYSNEDGPIKGKYKTGDPFKHTWENIQGTPFFMLGDQEKGYMAVMGRNQITQRFETKEELEEYIYTQPWELLINIMITVINTMQEMKSKTDTPVIANKVADILDKELGNMPEGWLKKNGLE